MKLPLVPIAAVTIGGISVLAAFAVPASAVGSDLVPGNIDPWASGDVLRAGQFSRLLLVAAAGSIGACSAGLFTFLLRRAPQRAVPHDVPAAAAVDEGGAATCGDGTEPLIGSSIGHMVLRPDVVHPPLFGAAPPRPTMPDLHAVHAASADLPRTAARVRAACGDREMAAHALLDRLERGVVRREAAALERGQRNRPRGDRGMDDALATLRSLARQA